MPLAGQHRRGWWTESHDLWTLLLKFRKSESANPLDSIYALLGICSDSQIREVIRPIYGLPVRDVVQKTLSHLLFSIIPDPKVCKFLSARLQTWLRDSRAGKTLADWTFEWALEKGHNKTAMRLIDLPGLDINEPRFLTLEPRELHGVAEKDPNSVARYWRTFRRGKMSPLIALVMYGSTKLIAKLVGRPDLNVNTLTVPDKEADYIEPATPLHLAAKSGRIDVVRLLLSRDDLDVNVRVGDEVDSLIQRAAHRGDHEIVGLLLTRSDLEINVPRLSPEDGRYIVEETPLQLAARAGHTKVVRLLLGRADLHVNACTSRYGLIALHLALENEHQDSVDLLLGKPDGGDISR